MRPMGDEPGAHATAWLYYLTLSFGPGAAVMIGAPVFLVVQWRDLKKCHVGAEHWWWGLNVEAVVMAERHALWEAQLVPKDRKLRYERCRGWPKARPRGVA